MVGPGDMGILLIDLVLSGVVAFTAIMLWSLTREPAWMLLIIGLVIRFGDVAFQTLHRFGIISVIDVQIGGISLFWMLLRATPLLFIIAGISTMIKNVRI